MSDLLEIVRRAAEVAKKKGASGAVAGVTRTREVETGWRDGKVEKVSEATTLSLSLSLFVDGRYSSISTSDLRPEAVDRFIEDGVALTRTLAADRFRALPEPALYEGRSSVDLQTLDASATEPSPEARRAFCQQIEEAARAARGAEAILSVSAGTSEARTHSARVHTNGFEGVREQTSYSAWADVSVKDRDGRRPEESAYGSVRRRADLPAPAALGREAAERAIASLGAKKAASARTTVVIENRAARRLLGALQGPLSARSLQQKQSFLEGKIGKPVAAKLLTLIDDPLLPRGQGSRHWDGDGIAARRRPVIEQGVLQSYYIDVYYGRKLGLPPTSGGPSNVVFSPGKKDLAGLLAEVKDGLFVTGFLGGNSNGTTGDFSFGIQGRIVRAGQLAEPFAEMNVSGNQQDLWVKLAALGSDPYPYSSVRAPTLVFEGVQVAGL